jgi:hypothetical protein
MDESSIIEYINRTCAGVDVVQPGEGDEPPIARGDTFFIYDPDRNLPAKHRFPFATIVTKDYGDYDKLCQLNRIGIFRLNIGVRKETFRSLFDMDVAQMRSTFDFAEIDQLMPHPVYAPQHWVCVLNPSVPTFEKLKPLLADAYQAAVERIAKTHPRD